MQEPFFNTFRPSRIAGGLLLWSAVFAYLTAGVLSPVAAVLGVSLLAIQDTSKLDAMRLIVFLWCAASLFHPVSAAIMDGLWVPAIRTILFTGAVAGLMFESLRESTIGILGVIGFGVLFF